MLRRFIAQPSVRSAAAVRGCCGHTHPLVPTPCTTLTDDERALQASVRQFALTHVAPVARQMDEESTLPKGLLPEAFKAGLMGIETPAEFGGAGMSFFSSILAIEELARVDAGFSGMIDVQNTLINNIFFRYANDAQRVKYLPMLASSCVGSFCLTEPGSGSDAFALKTRAERKGNKWVINGSKCYISNALEAELFLVMATVDPSKGYKGITCFIVRREQVRVGRNERKMGIRAGSTCEVHFTDVEVADEDVVLGAGKGYKIAIEMLNEGRIGIGAQQVGLAQGAMDIAMPYVFQRKQFGQLIGDFQGMQFQYAQQAMEIHAARLLVYNAARKKMHGEPFVEDASMAKLFASQVSEKTASKAIEWMGGNGFMRDNNVERLYRDAKAGSIYEGTSNIQLATIAKAVKDRYTKSSS